MIFMKLKCILHSSIDKGQKFTRRKQTGLKKLITFLHNVSGNLPLISLCSNQRFMHVGSNFSAFKLKLSHTCTQYYSVELIFISLIISFFLFQCKNPQFSESPKISGTGTQHYFCPVTL